MQQVDGLLVRRTPDVADSGARLVPLRGTLTRLGPAGDEPLWRLELTPPVPLRLAPDDLVRLRDHTLRPLGVRYSPDGQLRELFLAAGPCPAGGSCGAPGL